MSKHVTRMEIHDAEHYTPEQREAIIAGYPEHEREARIRGLPSMGSGRVFPIAEEAITCRPRPIERHWAQINGLDFGIDHPFGAVNLAHDRDADIVYVTKCYRKKDAVPAIHCAAIKPWGDWIPCAWPHDGLQRDKGSGEQLAEQYRQNGLNMLPERATHEEGGHGVEAGIMDILERMETDRFKVFAGLELWFEEFRVYHRKDGLIVKEADDLMAATRYASMMLREARTSPVRKKMDYTSKHRGLA